MFMPSTVRSIRKVSRCSGRQGNVLKTRDARAQLLYLLLNELFFEVLVVVVFAVA